MPKEPHLTTEAMRGAFMEAQGMRAKDIATTLDVRQGTVSEWRRRDDYKAEVEKWRNHELERLSDIMVALKLEVLDLVHEAIPKLREALNAVDEEGAPLWRVRMEAMRILFDKVKVEEQKQATEGATASASVIIVQRPTSNPDDVRILEGEVVEEVE